MLRVSAMPQLPLDPPNLHVNGTSLYLPPPPSSIALPPTSFTALSSPSSSNAADPNAPWNVAVQRGDVRHGQKHTSMSSMQYARPLQRTYSYPPRRSMKDEHEHPPSSSEHMLRRKTPNGILNAAYDGTAVEQTDRPHATKHILLPISDQTNGGVPDRGSIASSTQLRPHAQAFDPSYGSANHHNPNSAWPLPESRSSSWMPSQTQLPQIDSMLNQMPMQSPSLQPYLQPGHHPHAFMPPMPQLTFGPTASNDTGPFGPYWPNGTYVPYRPAALRDMRFYPTHAGHWPDQTAVVAHTALNSPWPATNNPYLDMSALNLNNQQSFMSHPMNSQHGPHASAVHGRDFYGPAGRSFGQQQAAAMGLQGSIFPQSRPPLSNHDSGLSSGQTTPTQNNYHAPRQSISEFGSESSTAQLQERVFSWAHSIYIDLLKYLHELRRHNHRIGNRHQSSGPHIYPRPPRQPGVDFTRPSMRHRSNSEYGSSSSKAHFGTENNGDRIHVPLHHLSRPFAARHSSDMTNGWSTHSTLPRNTQPGPVDRYPSLRRMTTSLTPAYNSVMRVDEGPTESASTALETLTEMCRDSGWKWIDGLLLGGCLAYALGDYQKATEWYSKILVLDLNHVEAMSNLAATMLATHRKKEAEQYWSKAVKLRPSYFEAVEHLVGLLCGDFRGKDAITVIEHVQKALRIPQQESTSLNDHRSETSSSMSASPSLGEQVEPAHFDYDINGADRNPNEYSNLLGADQPDFGSSGYSIAGVDDGRILQLVHAKGNMLYAMGENIAAAKAFEEAVMIGVGRQFGTVDGLIKHILAMICRAAPVSEHESGSVDPILIAPKQALDTAKLCFPPYGELTGLKYIPREGQARKAVISTTSNSLLSLAKIFQDGMASSNSKVAIFKTMFGVREILALYYLSLSLQPSPSTANNVGILLASVQQTAAVVPPISSDKHNIYPNVTPGSGVHLALLYYNFGLTLDDKHAHLYTNYGSLLKDIGSLQWAIKMYERAVECDNKFDIALANLANAVKDTGRIADAIRYYRRAVDANPDFAEAVCGLANALNSVCGWQGRGGIASKNGSYDRWHVNEENMPVDARRSGTQSSGWMKRVVDLVAKQLADGEEWGKGIITPDFVKLMLQFVPLTSPSEQAERQEGLKLALEEWSGQKWEGARVVRLVERIIKRMRWQWYQDRYISRRERCADFYKRPILPSAMSVPAAPTVLPFHTFTCPMSAKQVRQISQRNGLRISSSTLKAPWLPKTVYCPPAPPNPVLRVGYISSDFNNHPLAHLMQSVFGMHDRGKVEAYCYATTVSDGSVHRKQIERESPRFYDATSWSTEKLVNKVIEDGIHILVNLNGYTRGARNEVFAARPAPVQMSFMGFAGTLGAEWCDYLLADETAVPVSTLRPWRRNVDIEDAIEDESGGENEDWIYGENIVYSRDTFFCCDHRQSAPDAKEKQLTWDEEQERRWRMRKELFPTLSDDAVIFGNFNQLYKIEPTTFRTWLRILALVPNAVLWLLRFPDLGEQYLKQTAEKWSTSEVASRIIFTDVAAKHMHISRARVCDLFLDTPECNAHTTAADVLWSGTPLLTFPRYQYKMCSRMAASILKGALPRNEDGKRAARDLIATSEEDYEAKAIHLGNTLRYNRHKSVGRLGELRKILYEARWNSALFDTKRWVRDLEEAYGIAWERWVRGEGGDIWLDPKNRV